MSNKKRFTDLQLQVLEREKLDCIDVTKLLGDYQDNELPVTLRARVDAHIDRCPYCKEMEEGYRETVNLAGQLADDPMPVPVQNRLRQALNRRLGISLTLYE